MLHASPTGVIVIAAVVVGRVLLQSGLRHACGVARVTATERGTDPRRW